VDAEERSVSLPAIHTREVTKDYVVAELSPRARLASLLRREQLHMRTIARALRGVTLDVQRGEVLGLVGSNGAGKSTLLRVIAGMTPPTSGELEVNGRVTAILEITTGLVAEHTGRENVRYMGRLYGLDARELARKLDSIIEFADLGPFIDLPVRGYSSGMKARLAFSIVTSVEPDILLVDEALSVGDVGFVLRCRQRMRELCSRGSTVAIVSHNLQAIREMCDRAVWLHEGRVELEGDPAEVTHAYRAVAYAQAQRELATRYARLRSRGQDTVVRVSELVCRAGVDGPERHIFRLGEEFVVDATLATAESFGDVEGRLEIVRFDGVVAATVTERGLELREGENRLTIDLGQMRLGRFTYQARLKLSRAGEKLAEGQAVFAVEDHEHAYNASYYQDVEWRLLGAGS
jgi:lipopolysaccharide transport system ATP-binding protein